MRLAIEIITGRLFYVETSPDVSVGGLKKEIARKESFQENRLLLMRRNGCLLKDDKGSVKDYGVSDGSIIYLFFKPLEGSSWPTPFEDRVKLRVIEG